jgi:hypothetical protein
LTVIFLGEKMPGREEDGPARSCGAVIADT